MAQVAKYAIVFLVLLIAQPASSQDLTQHELTLEHRLQAHVRDTAYVNMLNALASAYFSNNPEKTKIYGSLAMQLADSLDYERGRADAFYSLSLIGKLKGSYADELDLHIKSIKIYQALNDTARMARAYDAMGAAYTQLADFESARESHLKAIELFKAIGDQRGMAMALRRIGNIELDIDNFNAAMRYYHEALTLEKENRNPSGIANCLNNMGVVYYELKQYDSALAYYQQSLDIITNINNMNRMPAAYYNLARIYLAQNKVDDALALAKKGLPIAIQIGSLPAQRESYKLHADIFSQKGDFQQAMSFYLKHSALKDSILNQERSVQFARLQSVYRSEEKDREIGLLKKNQELKDVINGIAIAGLVLFALVGLLIIYFQRQHIRAKKKSLELAEQHNKFVLHVNEELKANLEQIELKNKEIVALAGHLSQVNATKDKLFSIIGHDLRNPIHSLQGLLALVTSDSISREEFFQFSNKLKDGVEYFKFTLENLLHWSKTQMQGLQTNTQEIDVHGLADHNIRFLMKNAKEKNIELCNNIDRHLLVRADKDQLDIVIRNLISNAIKFTPRGGKVTLRGNAKDGKYGTITVADTGVGMDDDMLAKLFKKNIHVTTRGTQGEIGSGLGLLLCWEMIEKNNGKIWAESKTATGTAFHIELPCANTQI